MSYGRAILWPVSLTSCADMREEPTMATSKPNPFAKKGAAKKSAAKKPAAKKAASKSGMKSGRNC